MEQGAWSQCLGTVSFPSPGHFATSEDSPDTNREVPKESSLGEVSDLHTEVTKPQTCCPWEENTSSWAILREKTILKNLSNTLPVARWDSPSRGRKPHEGSSTGTAVPGTRALPQPPHIPRGSSMTAASQQEPRALVTAPRAPQHQQLHITVTCAGKRPSETTST